MKKSKFWTATGFVDTHQKSDLGWTAADAVLRYERPVMMTAATQFTCHE